MRTRAAVSSAVLTAATTVAHAAGGNAKAEAAPAELP